jgi:hypothetical protein
MTKHKQKDGLIMTLLCKYLGDVEIIYGDVKVIKGIENVTIVTSQFYKMMQDVYYEIVDIMNDELGDNEDYSYKYMDYDNLLNATSRYCPFKNPRSENQKRDELNWFLVTKIIDALITYELSTR